MTKTGSGALTLSGADTYSGTTTVNAGTLVVSGSISGSVTTVNSGGTLMGTGTTGAVTVNTGGSISAGANAGSIGTLNVGPLSLSGTYLLSLNSTLNTSDKLNVAGDLSLSGATLNLNDLALGNGGTNLTIAQYTGNLTGAGMFAGLPEGSLLDNGLYSIDYGQQFANSITLVAIPEPSGMASLLGGLGLLLGLQRRRRMKRA
jgi:autotransporter-associated beta strand protein